MDPANHDVLPPQRLAVAYAPQPAKASFSLLLRFDARFASVIGNANEPLIAQMKLAWWRDAIMASVSVPRKGEPLLTNLFELNDPALNQAVGQLADAWELLVGEGQWPGATVTSFAQMRGQAVFQAYATRCGASEYPAELAEQWAMDDLRLRFGNRAIAMPRADARFLNNRILRPLTILAMSVRGVSGPRLIWHALTGW